MSAKGIGRSSFRFLSVAIVFSIVLCSAFVGFVSRMPSARAGTLDHNVGDLDMRGLTDWGSLDYPLENTGTKQQVRFTMAEWRAFNGLIFDQAAYDHGPQGGLADFFDSGLFDQPGEHSPFPDFNVTAVDDPISFEVDDATIQRSYASFTQVDESLTAGNHIGVSYDVRMHQTAWSLAGKDWGIIEWRVQNIQGADITGANVGFGIQFTCPMLVPDGSGVGGDGNDDTDFWDASNSVYYVRDDFGTGPALGIASADRGNPMNHYYADEMLFFDSDMQMRSAMGAASKLTASSPPKNIAAILGWNGYTIPAGLSLRFPVVIAFGADDEAMTSAVEEARDFYSLMSSDVLFTEVRDSSSPGQRLEVYNDGIQTYDLSSWTVRNRTGASLSGSWQPDPSLAPAAYRYFDLTSGVLGPEGDVTTLYDGTGSPKGRLDYGQFGTAPDPLTGESSARFWNGALYRSDWSRDPTSTFGNGQPPWTDERNDVPQVNHAPEVVLNEVLFNPSVASDGFIELYYKGSGTISITGYRIVCDSEYAIGTATLGTMGRYFVLRYSSSPSLFSALTPGGDNVYLYDSAGHLLDMAGWNTSHTVGRSMARIPDGNGTHGGYDDPTSEAAGWRFDRTPTLPLIDIGPDQTKFGDFSDVVNYSLTVVNNQLVPDRIDVFAEVPQSWSIAFYDALNNNPLTDTNANGIPDTGTIGIGSSRGITARVTVPPSIPVGNEGIALVYGKANADPLVGDTTVQTTRLYPHLEVAISAEPTTIYVENAGIYGFNNRTTVTLRLDGAGYVVPGQAGPADVLFVIDDTGSMGDDIDHVKENVNLITDRLLENISDLRLGLVSYKDNSHIDLDLTTDIQAFRDAINALVAEGGDDYPEDVEGALNRGASNQVGWRLTPDVTKVMILIGDAEPHDIIAACNEAKNAYQTKDIITNTIATDDAGNTLDAFEWIAENGTGIFKFIPQLNPEDPEEFPQAIIEGVLMHIKPVYVAGYDPNTSDLKPMVSLVLPGYIHYVPGTFIDPLTKASKDPDHVLSPPAGITLQWEIQEIRVRKSWSVSFDATSSQAGLVPVDKTPDSNVFYTRWDNTERTDIVPEALVNVFSLAILAPHLEIGKAPSGGDVLLTWASPPSSAVDSYLIYRATSQTGFDFSVPWANTSSDINPLSGIVDPPNCTWADLDATNPASPNFVTEYYYIVRAENLMGMRSATSNTAGYRVTQFNAGLNTFSLPLEPSSPQTLDALMLDMGADSISWLDPNDAWQTYPSSPSASDAELGEGYAVEFSSPSNYVFTGEPASMILYNEGFGFGASTRDDIGASVNAVGDVTVSWTPIPGADTYRVLRSASRDGFHTGNYTSNVVTVSPFVDSGAASVAGELYYMVVPNSNTLGDGASTYSIGVVTANYSGNHMFGLPLKPIWGDKSADWYVDQIPDCLGIVYLEDGNWRPHFKEFPEGVYDTTVEMGKGYELSVFITSRYSFAGW